MRRNKTSLFIFGLSITLVLFLSVVLHSQMIGNSVNVNANSLIPHSGDSDELHTLNGSFNVTKGLSWVQEITVLDESNMNINFTLGDRLRYTITNINSSTVNIGGNLNTGETVFGKNEYFNSSTGDWDIDPTQPEMLLSIYNSTDNFDIPEIPYTYGAYKWATPLTELGLIYFEVPFYDCLPSEFSTANHTIVNNTYTVFQISGSATFNYINTTSSISSNWTFWNGTAGNDGSEANTFRIVYVFNNMGVCTLTQLYKNGTSWDLILELKLIRMGPPYPLDFGNILGSYTYGLEVDPRFWGPIVTGDKSYISITDISRDLTTPDGVKVDVAVADLSFYNSTNHTTDTMADIALGIYNKTHSFNASEMSSILSGIILLQYFSQMTDMALQIGLMAVTLIPLDFFAANYTLCTLNQIGFLMGDPLSTFHYNYTQDLSTNNIAGTWTFWNGTAENDGTETGTIFQNCTFNSEGILTVQGLYINGTTGWELLVDFKLIEEEEVPLGLLLLGALAGGGGGIGMTEILIIALIAGIGVIVLIIAISKARG